MNRFDSVLLVSPLADGRTWIIERDFGYVTRAGGGVDRIEVPLEFLTDFASVPRLFWFVFPQWGKYGNAAVVHDYLYWSQLRPRVEADRIFHEAMSVLEVPGWQRFILYWSVRLFGWSAWRSNQRKKQRGYTKRVAIRSPILSTMTAKDVQGL